ncbi:MAG TPA: ATP synthase F1 subunit delta [Kofleriaceae bacterium]|nr:ATP synthase F1 subunit delta [Kofleriaceae bacterium]
MISGSIARRYAKALLQIGIDDGNYERLGREVRALARAVKSSPELAQTLSNPAFPRADREKVLKAVLQRLGASQVVVNFTRLLLERERLGILADISRELDAMIDARAGRVIAQVTSAAPLDAAQRDRLTRTLEKISGKKVDVQIAQDPALLAGVVAKVGDTVYDGSLRTQLEKMRTSMVG